jgi:hypothetical protein
MDPPTVYFLNHDNHELEYIELHMSQLTFLIENDDITTLSILKHAVHPLNILGTKFETLIKRHLKEYADTVDIYTVDIPTITFIFRDEISNKQFTYIHNTDIHYIDKDVIYEKNGIYDTFNLEFEEYLSYWSRYTIEYIKLHQNDDNNILKKLKGILFKERK